MVIGERFAYGHIPKTGGDAVHDWLAQIDGLEIDPTSEARKHHFFWERNVQKEIYALSIRRLPSWALSYLHELAFHPKSAEYYGIPPSDTTRPEHAFRLRPDDYLRQHQKGGRTIKVWLRMEYLFDDVVRFIDECIEPITPHLLKCLEAVPTKGRRNYDHDIGAFFTSAQIAELYERNPLWAAAESLAYGQLCPEATGKHARTKPAGSRSAVHSPNAASVSPTLNFRSM